MKTKRLYYSWLCLFILSAAMGFIREPGPLVSILMVLVALGFYVPGGMLLYHGISRGQRKHLRNVLIFGIASLLVTVVLFCAYLFAVVYGSQLLHNILYALLVIVSAPMMCGQVMALSIFLWACMIFTAIAFWKKTE